MLFTSSISSHGSENLEEKFWSLPFYFVILFCAGSLAYHLPSAPVFVGLQSLFPTHPTPPNIELRCKLLGSAFLKSLTSDSWCLPSPCSLSILVSEFTLNMRGRTHWFGFLYAILSAGMSPRACICTSCLLKEALFPLDDLRGEPKRIKKKKNHNKTFCRCRLTLKLGCWGTPELLGTWTRTLFISCCTQNQNSGSDNSRYNVFQNNNSLIPLKLNTNILHQ